MKTFGYLIFAFALVFVFSGITMAQQITPMIQEGTEELGLTGNLDFESPAGSVDWFIRGSYGRFLTPLMEAGAFASYTRAADGDIHQITAGLFGEYHFLPEGQIEQPFIPYIGSDLGLLINDNKGAEDNLVAVIAPRVGFKWFIRDYVAVDTNLFVSFASDDIYINDNELDSYDVGMRLGLRIYLD